MWRQRNWRQRINIAGIVTRGARAIWRRKTENEKLKKKPL